MNRKYCKSCNRWYDNTEFKYCPECAGQLISDVRLALEGLFLRYSYEYVLKCDCGSEYFPKDYKVCPYCKSDLEKVEIFFIDWDKEVLSSRFMDFSYSATFDELYEHYVLTKGDRDVPEHDVYESVLRRIDEYFKSKCGEGNCCRNCDERFNLNYNFCPFCGEDLVDCEYLMILDAARSLCEGHEINRCEECGEEYPADFKYCPMCASQLKREEQFWIDEEKRLIKAYWNGEEISMTFQEFHQVFIQGWAYDAPIPICPVSLILYYKEQYDEEFENSFSGREMPEKLTYPEMEKLVKVLQLVSANSYGFMNSEMILNKFGVDWDKLNVVNPEIRVIDLRDDLFYVFEYLGDYIFG